MNDHSTEGELLFTEAEWPAAQERVVKAMTAFLMPYRAALFEDLSDHGAGWGTGSYLQLGERVFILTNEHVAFAREADRRLVHQLHGEEELRPIVGNHVSAELPRDLALLPVGPEAWATSTNRSSAIGPGQLASEHAPFPFELLTFVGFAGANVGFVFNTLVATATCLTAREVPLPKDDRFDPRFHFGMDYKPDLATDVIGKEGLPLPPGLSGSTVWNTRFVEARAKGIPWSPELAQVTGVVWGWPSDVGCLVATRAEHLRGFLVEAARSLGVQS